MKENGDTTVRDLFSIRGFGDDEHDPQIPSLWFRAPPLDLTIKTKEMEALRVSIMSQVLNMTADKRSSSTCPSLATAQYPIEHESPSPTR